MPRWRRWASKAKPAGAHERLRLATGRLELGTGPAVSAARSIRPRRALHSIDAQLESASQREAALAQAQRDEPARFEAFAARIAQLEQRIQALSRACAALAREQQAQIQELAVAELQRQKQRLAVYATQARFAVAQLYDRATLATHESGDAKQP